jgi:RNA-binding protein
MPTPSHLTGKQRRFLRGRGHSLQPVAQIGKEGLSAAFVHAVDQALETHELIKVRVGQNAMVDRKDAAAQLAVETDSHVAQVLGSTILLYRRHPEDPVLRLP